MNKSVQFNRDEHIPETQWAIKPVMPFGHLVLLVAQSGIGKSLLCSAIATHAVCEEPFCGFEVAGGDVLIIDENTPTGVLKSRLRRIKRGIKGGVKHNVYIESMNRHNLKDLPKVIDEYPSVKYVILHSLTTLSNGLNLNSRNVMYSSLAALKKCISQERVIILVHHISDKSKRSTADLMTGPTGSLAMYSSAIVQQADTYFVMASTVEGGKLNKLYIRPVSMQEVIPQGPFAVSVTDGDDDSIRFREVDYDVLK